MNDEEKNIKKKRQEEYRKILEQQIKSNELSQRPYSTKENFKMLREKSNENIQAFTSNNNRNENYSLSNIQKVIQSENIFEESKLKRLRELSQINQIYNNVTENNRDYNFTGKVNNIVDKNEYSNIQCENINNEIYPTYMDQEYFPSYKETKETKTDLFDNLLIYNEKDIQRKKKLEYQLELKKQIEQNKKRKEEEKLKIKKEEDDFYKKYGNEFQYFNRDNFQKNVNNKEIIKNDEKYYQNDNKNLDTYTPTQEIRQDLIEYSNSNKNIEKSINQEINKNNLNSNEQNLKDYNFTNNNIFELINEQKKLIIEYQKTLEKIKEEKNEAEASCKYFSEQAQLQKINNNIHYKSKYEELNETENEIEIDKSLNCETKLIKINSHNEHNLLESWYDNYDNLKKFKTNYENENKNIDNERNKFNFSKKDIKIKNEERYNENKLIHRKDEKEKFDKNDSKNEINLSYNLNLDEYNEIREQEKFKSKANFFDDNEIKLKETKNEPIIQSKCKLVFNII